MMASPRLVLYHLASFLSAFLLFQVQPLLSKWLLPAFGGSYLVWGAALVFFQVTLLAGYCYSHAIQQFLGSATYGRIHPFLILAALIFCPLGLISSAPTPVPGLPLPIQIALELLIVIGAPFLILSTTTTVLQRWLMNDASLPKRDPYVLFASSNLGSFIGLFSHPLVMEPLLPMPEQARVWLLLFGFFTVFVFLLAPWRTGPETGAASPVSSTTSPWEGSRLVLGLSATTSFLLLAVTNVLTFDLAAVPLLWTIPLGLYLLSFTLVFKASPWCPPWLQRLAPWAVMLGIMLHIFGIFHLTVPPFVHLAALNGILFIGCMVCHDRLRVARPASEADLSRYYVLMALGGATGALVVTWIIPCITRTQMELVIALAAVAAFLPTVTKTLPATPSRLAALRGLLLILGLAASLLIVPSVCPLDSADHMSQLRLAAIITSTPCLILLVQARHEGVRLFSIAVLSVGLFGIWSDRVAAGGLKPLERLRNYYGIYTVYEQGGQRYLQHGTTLHGRQQLPPGDPRIPLAYFHPSTPAGNLLLRPPMPIRDIAMIGLGTGAMAMYGVEGGRFTIFELDPDNVPIARQWFSYLELAEKRGVHVEIQTGDGRLLLQQQEAGTFDLIIVDAFNSGSIPTHLLTLEAFQDYFRVLRPNGLLLLHISNKALNLAPLVDANARALGLYASHASNIGHIDPDANETQWAALSRSDGIVHDLIHLYGWGPASSADKHLPPPWTDQFSNILALLLRK